MMTPVNVLTLGDFISPEGMDLVVEAFTNLYDEVSPKHKKKLKLHIIGGSDYLSSVQSLNDKKALGNSLNLIDSSDDTQIRKLYNSDAVLVLPIKKEVGKVVPEAFSFGIPLLCFDTPEMRDVVDQTCAMFAPICSKSQCAEYFSRNISILYFDPEVRKIMRRGAEKRYEQFYNWGKSRTRMSIAG